VLKADLAVRRGLVVPDAQVLLQVSEDGVAAHHRAERVGADADVVLAHRLALVHRVERGHRGDVRLGQPELLGAEGQPVGGHEAFLGLHQVQQRQQRRAGPRVAADDLRSVRLQAGAHVVAERH
jgi:hypothetical protein